MEREVMIGISFGYRDSPSSLLQSDTEGVDESCVKVLIYFFDQSIDYYIYLIIAIYSDIKWISYRVGRLADLESDKSHIRDSLRQLFASHLITIEGHRHEDMEPISFAKLRHIVDNMLETIFFEWDVSMIDTIWCPDTRIEKSVKIIYFCNGSYCRSWIVRHGLLMDGDRRGESLDLADMGCLRDI